MQYNIHFSRNAFILALGGKSALEINAKKYLHPSSLIEFL